ncbi:hypothetical protein ACP4OV_008329 [Aristida adscensionis]
MATEAPRYRRLRKASDLSPVTAASPPPKRMRMDKQCISYEDRISNLPDEILIMILDKLDTRTTVTTIILSKRWRDLPRELPTFYNLAVDDMLPPRYHQLKRLNTEVKAAYEAEKNRDKLTDFQAIKSRHERWMAKIRPLTAILERYERRAMRRYVKQVDAFLLAPENVRQRRSVRKLRIQTVGRGWQSSIDEWITTAIAKWGIEDFELVADDDILWYDLKKLDEHQDFRIISSSCFRATFHISVPTSKIRNLEVERCSFGKIYLISLPRLEKFICRGRPTKLSYGDVPQLKHVSLDYSQTEDDDRDDDSGVNRTYPPSKFFKMTPQIDCLVLQFKGPQMWIEPLALPSPFSHLKKLFIANVPMNWDTLWILLLLDSAPALESFIVHFDNSLEDRDTSGHGAGLDVDVQQHHYRRLKELVVAGFDGLRWQTGFVRLIMKRSPLLRRVQLLDGHVRGNEQELGGLEIVPRSREWHECERAEVLDDLTAGIRWPPVIVLE